MKACDSATCFHFLCLYKVFNYLWGERSMGFCHNFFLFLLFFHCSTECRVLSAVNVMSIIWGCRRLMKKWWWACGGGGNEQSLVASKLRMKIHVALIFFGLNSESSFSGLFSLNWLIYCSEFSSNIKNILFNLILTCFFKKLWLLGLQLQCDKIFDFFTESWVFYSSQYVVKSVNKICIGWFMCIVK